MSQNDSSNILKKWRSGVEFSFAWHEFADPHALQKFRGTTTLEAAQAEQILMVADLWAGLRDGELQAFGKCVAPKISDGPILLPLHTFEFAPPHGIEESNVIKVSGWRYEDVKVVQIREANAVLEPEIALKQEQSPESVMASTAIQSSATVSAKRGGGNKSLYNDVRAVLADLFIESGAYRSAVAQRLLEPFNKRYVERYSTSEIKRGRISERTLRDHLKTYRQELAEIGGK